MRYARVEDSTVREVGDFDSVEGRFHPSLVWVECGAEVAPGWAYEAGSFSAPASVAPVVPLCVTMRQARLALLQQGLLAQVESAVNGAGQAAQIEWEFSNTVERNKELVLSIAQALDLTETQIDDLFKLAATL